MNHKTTLIALLVTFALILSIAFATTQYNTATAQPEFSKLMKKPGPREGTILAGVYAYCTNGDPAGQGYAEIRRYFNKVNDLPITISEGTQLGYCTIDFSFDVWQFNANVDLTGCRCRSAVDKTDATHRFTRLVLMRMAHILAWAHRPWL